MSNLEYSIYNPEERKQIEEAFQEIFILVDELKSTDFTRLQLGLHVFVRELLLDSLEESTVNVADVIDVAIKVGFVLKDFKNKDLLKN